jgi:hypothetical protein
MKLIGIPLRKPSFNEITASMVMGVGLWLTALGVMHAVPLPMNRADAGALLIVVLWGCLCVRLGIHVGRGSRHLLANIVVGAALLGLYQAAWALAA